MQTLHSNAGDKQTRPELEGHENEIREEEDDTKKILTESSNRSRKNEKYVSVMKELRHNWKMCFCKDFKNRNGL